jgi:hypothetical protein
MTASGVLWVALVALVVTGCPGKSEGPTKECKVRGEQCAYSPGTLGVCNDTPCEEGKMPPCLKCASQH